MAFPPRRLGDARKDTRICFIRYRERFDAHDHLTISNPPLIQTAIEEKACNGLVLKVRSAHETPSRRLAGYRLLERAI